MAKKHISSTQSKPGIKAWITSQPAKLRTDLRTALSSIRKAFDPRLQRELLWWHRVGSNVAKFFPDGQRQHGSSVMELFAKELGAVGDNEIRSVSNTLWQARTIAKTLGSATAAKTWAKKRNGKDRPLSAYHVFAVANVEASEQPELLEKCLNESWSVRQLRQEVQNRFGKKRSRGGRKAAPRKVPSPKVALQDIQRQTRQWLADHKAWFAGPKAALRNVSKREQTMELQTELIHAWNALVDMQVAVETGIDRLRELEVSIEDELG